MRQHKKVIFFVLLLVGFFYRLYLATLTEPRIIWDMEAYNDLALSILSGGFAASCCNHGIGYPLFLAVLYAIFGTNNLLAVRLSQIILDVCSAYLVYRAAKQLSGENTANISFILFLLNPFTASYTGLRLGETILVFIVSALGFFLTKKDLHRSVRTWFILGCFLAIFVATKVAYYFFVILFGFLMLALIPDRKKLLSFVLLFSVGFFVMSFYSLAVNYIVYKKASIIPPYRTTGGLLYASFSLGRYPELSSEFRDSGVSMEYSEVTNEYYEYVNASPQRLYLYQQKYLNKFLERMKSEWPTFMSNTGRNIVWMWDKRFLALYSDPWYPSDTLILQMLNIFYIVAFGIGVITYIAKKRLKVFLMPFFVFSIVYFLYISVVLGMVSNETRLTIPYYPLIFLWAGYGLQNLFHTLGLLYPRKSVS